MKKTTKDMLVALFIVLGLGFICPALVSSDSDLGVVLGFIYFGCILAVLARLAFILIIKKDLEDDQEC